MEIPILRDLLVVVALAVAILTASHRIRLPGIVGLLIAGVTIGPHGLGMMSTTHEVEVMAEIGVVLLLFTIGIEFSLTRLFRIRRLVLLGGSLQVGASIGATWLIGIALGLPTTTAVFVGFMVAMSSTAIVLQTLQERGEIEAPHGRAALGLLIFQDVAIVPLMLLAPLLAGTGGALGESLALLAAKLVGVVVLVFLGSRYLVPWILERVAEVRSRELFVLCGVAICLAVAWLTSSLGLSLGLGAFLAGLIISESNYSHQTLGGILPFRDVFTSLFFVSIGMLLDLGFVVEHPVNVILAFIGLIVLKFLVVGAVMLIVGYPKRAAVLTAIAICQAGEFSFLLAGAGIDNGLIDQSLYQTFLAASILSMIAAPFLIRVGPSLLERLLPRPAAEPADDDATEQLSGHIVIIGFGFGGHSVARAARRNGIRYLIIDTNPTTVRSERAAGEPIEFGDAAYPSVLQHVGAETAASFVVVVNDPIATRVIVQNIRDLNRDAPLIVRTRFMTEVEYLLRLGATHVIPEEFETSVEVSARMLAANGVAAGEITATIDELRGDHYATMRGLGELAAVDDGSFAEPSEASIFSISVTPDSPLGGRSLAELDLRAAYGLTLLQIRRGEEIIVNPPGSTQLLAEDTLLLFGPRANRHALLRAEPAGAKTTVVRNP